MNHPLKMVCELDSLETAQKVLQYYQRADEGQLRKAAGRPLLKAI